MRVLGVDYGLARIGLALSDPSGLLAQGLSVLKRKSDKQAIEEITSIIHEHGVEHVVVGYPRNMNGSVGERAEHCETIAHQIEAAASVPVSLYDERLTTVAAERLLIASDMRRNKRKQVIDAVAATILLQGFLDSRAARH